MARAYIVCFVLLSVASVAFAGTTGSSGNGIESLKQHYEDSFVIGVAIPGFGLNEEEQELLFRNFGTVTPENCMKPSPVHPEEDRFDFAEADALVEMAHAHGLTVNGHALIWHENCPDWFFADGNRPAGSYLVLNRMRNHIAVVAGRYAGKVKSWDVVNEALSDFGYLRKSKWLSSIGEDYIAEAFFAARKADPHAELYYNDYNIELPLKRQMALCLIRDLKRRGAPIQGIGIQGHWKLDMVPFKHIEDAIISFQNEGLKVMITELDIDVVTCLTGGFMTCISAHDPFAIGLPNHLQQRLANQYAKLFALFYKHRDKIDRVTFWGLHDGRTWLNYYPSERTNHPLLWDRQLQPKPALSAVLEVGKQ